MLTQLFKLTLYTSLWLWLKPRWKGLLILAVWVLLVSLLHGEYLEYVQISGHKEFLVSSYIVKWTLLLLALLIYFAVAAMGLSLLSRKSTAVKESLPAAERDVPTADDGFNFLRQKKHLQSRAEKLLDRE